jgi:hypothetical protein
MANTINTSRAKLITALLMLVTLHACTPQPTPAPTTQRSFRMGFQNSAPSYNDFNKIMTTLNMWTTRADAAIISLQVPWDTLLAGVSPQSYVDRNYTGLVNYYRGKNLKLWLYVDPANGLDRSSDALDLKSHGKSIAQPAIQQLYRRYCFVMDSMLKPEHFGFALETNLIRSMSPDSIYNGVKTAANAAAADIAAKDPNVKLSISIQVDWAWGMLNGGTYIGIAQDFTDFPFIQELGMSSYPYFVYDNPSSIPSDYYSRIIQGHSIPVFVSEGGWSSQKVGTYDETPQKQADYFTKQIQLLDNVSAIALFQLSFCDINTNALAHGTPANLNQFAWTGLVDTNLTAKPALTVWDRNYQRRLMPGH